MAEFQEFPKMVTHPEKGKRVVQTAAEEQAFLEADAPRRGRRRVTEPDAETAEPVQ
jgi:hypothetical protein